MTSFERWSLVGLFAGVGVNLILFIVFSLQLVALRRQVEQSKQATALDHDRRRSQATIEFYRDTMEKRSRLRSILPHDTDADGILTYVQRARTDESALSSIVEYIGLFELLAAGVNVGVFDIDVLNLMAGRRIAALVENYGPWIEERRVKLGQPLLYAELTDVAGRFKNRPSVSAVRSRARISDLVSPETE